MSIPTIPKSILIIQTAFLGDVILATALVEKLHAHFPDSKIDFLLRKGNEQVLTNNPKVNRVLIWDKHSDKYRKLFKLMQEIRRAHYDLVVNVQRFGASGFLTAFSGAKKTIGFDKNPFSFLFSEKVKHVFEGHEVERNQKLIESLTSPAFVRPALYPSQEDERKADSLTSIPFVCIAPASVWFTKQFPKERWVTLIESLPTGIKVMLLGAKTDVPLCEEIIQLATNTSIENLAGKLSITETAALMKRAAMNFANDSAPLHIASAINAPVTAVFCSTIPQFGFGPLSDKSFVVEIREKLYCRPCGIHGWKACPEGHFRCAYDIDVNELVSHAF